MLRNDYTVPTTPRWNSRPSCASACRALRQPIGYPIRYFVTRATTSKTSQFVVIKRSTGIGSHTSESFYSSYKVATSCVNRCASWICHILLARKKLQENLLHMIAKQFSSLATHNTAVASFSVLISRETRDMSGSFPKSLIICSTSAT
jgi:hypothetical protein